MLCQVRGILGEDVAPDAPLLAAGLDSLAAIELCNDLAKCCYRPANFLIEITERCQNTAEEHQDGRLRACAHQRVDKLPPSFAGLPNSTCPARWHLTTPCQRRCSAH